MHLCVLLADRELKIHAGSIANSRVAYATATTRTTTAAATFGTTTPAATDTATKGITAAINEDGRHR